MGTPTTTPNLREALEAQGRKIGWVAKALGLTPYTFTHNVLNQGRVTPAERSKLCEVLGYTPDEIDAILQETERRPQMRKGGAA